LLLLQEFPGRRELATVLVEGLELFPPRLFPPLRLGLELMLGSLKVPESAVDPSIHLQRFADSLSSHFLELVERVMEAGTQLLQAHENRGQIVAGSRSHWTTHAVFSVATRRLACHRIDSIPLGQLPRTFQSRDNRAII
jgi:hypothetical protein